MVALSKIKEIAELLLKISCDENSVAEILKVVKDDEGMADKLLQFLTDYPDLVLSEVYDELSKISNGKYEKYISELYDAKMEYVNNPGEMQRKAFLNTIRRNNVLLISTWDLNEEEKKKIRKCNIGDDVEIFTKPEPLLFEDEKDESILIPVFTSMYEIKCKYQKKYAIEEHSWESVIALANALRNTLGKKVKIAVDDDSDTCLIITEEEQKLK